MYVVFWDCDHIVDVGLFGAVRTPLFKWQKLEPASGDSSFYDFCDALEVLNGTFVSGPDGWGLGHALDAWAKYSKDTLSISECSMIACERVVVHSCMTRCRL